MNRRIYTSIILLVLISAYIPGSAQIMTNQDTIQVVATTTVIADAVKNIGGDLVTVETLMNVGVDPHDFEPTPSDIDKINNSQFIFWIGAGVEEGLEDLLHYWENQGKSLAVIETINETALISSTDNDHAINPHFWLDPVLWKDAVSAIGAQLIEIDGDHAQDYQQNLENYLQELDNLHSNIITQVDKLDEQQKFLVSPHNAFIYYATRYGFETKTLQGISTSSEAGVQEIDILAQYLKDNNISVVFSETTTPSDNIEAVIDAANAMGHTVVLGGQLYTGSVGDTEDTDSYIEMIMYNTETIVESILNPPEATNQGLPLNWSWIVVAIINSALIIRIRRQKMR